MKKLIFTVFIITCCILHTGNAWSKEKNAEPPRGTSEEEVAELKSRPLPHPNDIKVVILPLWSSSGSRGDTRIGTSATWLLCQREGFDLMPILDGFAAVDGDNEMEPGLPIRREDAERIGRKLGADWVIYGEIQELRHYHKRSWFKDAKYSEGGFRLAVLEIPEDKDKNASILYWQMRKQRRGGTGFF